MKYIDWLINREELKSYSLEEFNRDDGSVYGFMVLKLGGFTLGFIDGAGEREGDEDISFYVNQLIKCGIALQRGEVFKVGLLNSNLLEIRVNMDKTVVVEVWNIYKENKEYTYELSLVDVISEIESTYLKYISDIKEINESLLQSKLTKNTSVLYETFMKTLEN
jgi:hypothetical protein